MPKKKAPSPQKRTHFEKVPLEVVARIATVDQPLVPTSSPSKSLPRKKN